jgi:hypothetical protein
MRGAPLWLFANGGAPRSFGGCELLTQTALPLFAVVVGQRMGGAWSVWGLLAHGVGDGRGMRGEGGADA